MKQQKQPIVHTSSVATNIPKQANTGLHFPRYVTLFLIFAFSVIIIGSLIFTGDVNAFHPQSTISKKTLRTMLAKYSISSPITDVQSPNISTGDGSWVWLNTKKPYTNLYDISCPAPGVCFVVGEYGLVMSTMNNGNDWSILTSGVTNKLKSISCPSITTCFIVGEGLNSNFQPLVLKTQNTGNKWSIQNIPAYYLIDKINCPTTNTCYIVGEQGSTLKTTDGGGSWQTLSSLSKVGIDCLSAAVCYAVGSSGSIEFTNNGGNTWVTQASATNQRLNSITCVSISNCYAASFTTIIKTTNAGANWTSVPITNVYEINAIKCLANNHCLLLDANLVKTTTDGGNTWTISTGNKGNYSIACQGSQNCIVVGETGKVITTSDGGNT